MLKWIKKLFQKKKKTEDEPIDSSDIIKRKLRDFDLTRKHLVVDDSETNRYVLRKYLERIGIEIDQANDGIECLDIIKSNLNKYDVIWMDIRMPYKDGIETTTDLRKMGYSR